MAEEAAVWRLALDLIRAGERPVLVVVVDCVGSVPGTTGAAMVVGASEMAGTIGGGVAEYTLVDRARATTAPALSTYDHTGPDADSLCAGIQTFALLPLGARDTKVIETLVATLSEGGVGTLRLSPAGLSFTSDTRRPIAFAQRGESWSFQQTVGRLDTLVLVGGGHVALALSRVMATLPFRIEVLDNREDLPTMLDNSWAHERRVVDYDQVAEHVPEGDQTYVAIMTWGHHHDQEVLRQLAGRRYAYLGMMGSAAKVRQIRENLETLGVAPEALAAVRAPIGVPIGSHTPEEIAISIAAELVQVRNGRAPSS